MVHASAPGRGGIIGNPSDIYGGTVVSCAISERAEAVISESPRMMFDIYGHFAEISSPQDLEFVPDMHYLDVAKAVWRYLRKSEFAEKGLLDPNATFHVRAQSSIPLKADGEIVGTITTSGEADAVDHEAAAEALARYLARP